MKVWPIFSFVILIHLALIGLLLFQPGCQSAGSAPQPEQTRSPAMAPTVAPPSLPAEPVRGLDPAFNAGLGGSPAAAGGGRQLSAPRRPDSTPLQQPDTGLLQPVLEPASDPFRLPGPTTEYEVVSGDTLSAIARKTGTDLSALLAANNLTRQSTIYVGQMLLIPDAGADVVVSPDRPGSVAPEPIGGREIEVRAGDTLSGIAARHGTTVSILKRLNGLSSDTIYVGQKLMTPDSGDSTPPTLPEPPAPTPVVTPSGAGRYTVKPGDTPSGIARSFGVSVASLMEANGISDARRMSVGRELVIPATGSAGGSARTTGAMTPAPVREPSLPEIGRGPSTAPERPVSPQTVDPLDTLESLDGDLPYTDVEEVTAEDPGAGN